MAFKMKGIKSLVNIGSPLKQQELTQAEMEALKYTDKTFTKNLEGENIALSGESVIKGEEIVGDKIKPGDPGYEQWLAAVKENPEIENKFKDQKVIRERDYNRRPDANQRPDGSWYITTRDPQDGVSMLNYDPGKTIDINLYEIEGMDGLSTPNEYLGKLYKDRGYDGTDGSISESDIVISQEIWNNWRNETGLVRAGFDAQEFTGDGKPIGGQTEQTSDYKYRIDN